MRRVNVAYCLITDPAHSKVLMVKNIDEAGDRWSLPGGAVEEGESLEQAAMREAKEETGLDVTIHGIVAINECVFSAKQEHVLFITFKAETCGGNEQIIRPDEIAELAWVDLEEAEQLMPYYQGGLRKMIGSQSAIYFNEGEK